MSKKQVGKEESVAGELSPLTEFDELCRQVLHLIYDTEKQLRDLMAERCQQEWGDGWQDALCKRHVAVAEIWLDRQAHYRPTLDTYGLPPVTLLDHSTLGELRNVILAEWQLFRDIFQFRKDSGRENKKTLDQYLEWIIEVRNPLSHSLPVHPHQLRRAWVMCDEIRMQIAKCMGESLWKRAPAEEEGVPEQPAIRHFMALDGYLTRPGPHFPKVSDFEEELVYLPEEHVSIVRKMLGATGRCLLIGRSAAGKTVLAIALGRQLQETEGYKVFYGDAIRAQEGDGRAWYQEVCANDREGFLYVLDDSHLAPKEVNEFCFQWEGTPPKHAQAILISRPRTGEPEAQPTEIGDYCDMWADVTVEVQPEEIYHGVIEKYATAYRRRDPVIYVALEDDNETLLEMQHAHNLVASRSRLEAWFETGGRLSEVTQEKVYEALAQKYLSKASEALPALCVLWQYEVPAHNVFVAGLPEDEVDWLEKENLLTYSIVRGYGLLYQPVFHPDEAREIFNASIYRQWGHVDAKHIGAEIVSSLEAYLKARPPNYVSVYSGLYDKGQRAIMRQLLSDRDLQDCAASLFAVSRISDTASYLDRLSKVDRSRAQALLDELVHALRLDGICSRMLKHALGDIRLSLRSLRKVDAKLVQEIVDGIDMKHLGKLAGTQSRQDIFWLLDILEDISPKQAKTLLESIPAQAFAANATASSFHSIRDLLASLLKRHYPSAQLKELVETIDMKQVAQRTEAHKLLDLYWLIRDLKAISPAAAKSLLDAITPAGLASLCHSKDATAQALGDFCKVSSRNFRRRFLRQFSAQDVAAIFDGSPLGQVGTFLQHRYFPFKKGYALSSFADFTNQRV